ncbi:MAG: hypothetical protein PHR61_02460 [Candidatus Absconditabacteria bacterium]|nr:hypothetical protein [Candidatus Absconditabacteria bacterium]
MEKKQPKHRKVAKAIINHPIYQRKKAKSKVPHRFDMWEDSVVGGLHIFEWLVIGLVSIVAFGIVALSVKSFAGIPVGGGTGVCPTCKTVPSALTR